ncbi:MAG: hypothetical protein IKB13_02915 [Clostridia bacterium]|nr:hypothetical protein [Clostridia bacterium]
MQKNKKRDLLLLIVVLLFSFSALLCWVRNVNRKLPLQRYMESVNAAAVEADDVTGIEPEPWVCVSIADYAENNAYIFASVVIQDLPDVKTLEVELTYNPEVLQFNVYPEDITRTERDFQSIQVTEVSPGVLRIACIEPCVKDWQSVFESVSFLYDGQGEPNFAASLVACKDADGVDIDAEFMLGYANEVSELPSEKQAADQDGYAVPTVKVEVNEPACKAADPPKDFSHAVLYGQFMSGHYRSCSMEICVYPKDYSFENCELLITYNPDVLEYSLIGYVDGLSKLTDKVLAMEEGKIRLLVYDRLGGALYTDPIGFNVIGSGEAELNVELLSYTDRSGVCADAQLVADIPEMKLKASDLYVENMSIREHFLVGVKKTVRFFCDVFQYGDLYG